MASEKEITQPMKLAETLTEAVTCKWVNGFRDHGPEVTLFDIAEEVYAYAEIALNGQDAYGKIMRHEWWYNGVKKWEWESTCSGHYTNNWATWTWWAIGKAHGEGTGHIKIFFEGIYMGKTSDYTVSLPICEDYTNQIDCEAHGCYWYNGACHSTIVCADILTQTECKADCYWWNGACHDASPMCSQLNNQSDCEWWGCRWWNGACHGDCAPSCATLNNQSDCERYGCSWYDGSCHIGPIGGGDAFIYRAGYAARFYPNVPFDMMVGVKNYGPAGDYCRVEICDDDTGAVLYESPEVYIQAGCTFMFISPITVNQTTAFHCRVKAYHGSSLDDSRLFTIPYDTYYPRAEITAFDIVPNPVSEGGSTIVSITGKNIGPTSEYFCIGIYSDQHGTLFSDWFWVDPRGTFQWPRVLSGIEYSQLCMPMIQWWDGTTGIEVDYGFATIFLSLLPVCEDYMNQIDCEAAGCHWYDGSCHTLPPPGPSGFALKFNGIDTYVEVADSPSLDIANAITIEAWIYLDDVTPTPDWRTIIAKIATQNAEAYGFLTNSDQSTISFYKQNVSFITDDIQKNKWNHVVATFTTAPGDNICLYVDGSLRGCGEVGHTPISISDLPLVIGGGTRAGNSFAPYFFKGLLDKIRIYNRILTPTEVQEHFNGIFNDETGLAALWNFDEGSGNVTADASGNENNGTLFNNPQWVEITPLPPSDLCIWLGDHGAPDITVLDVFTIINSYLFETPPSGYTFVPTLQNIFGVIDYFFGFDGDAMTGCDFYP